MQKLLVSEPSLTDFKEFSKLAQEVWQSGILTHNGPKVQELEKKLKEKFEIPHLSLVTNGTIALELAMRALNLPKGSRIITTPFTWIATSSAIQWQDYEPLFVDINPQSLNIDPKKIEEALNTQKNISAILAVHVFSNPCEVEKIDEIAKKWGIKVIYDGAHSVGVKYKGQDLSAWGDITTHSYHATKIYNCGEGGAIIANDLELAKRVERLRFFGHDEKKEIVHEGTNAKMHEISACIGLANLSMLDETIIHRRLITIMYRHRLKNASVDFQRIDQTAYNYSYCPIIFDSEETCLRVFAELLKIDVLSRRYFHPSINELSIFNNRVNCPVSEDISRRILCLPCHDRVDIFDVDRISHTIINSL
jgi:dTDP-4-amino-4,6-dideoxygalactose transaminase